MEKISAIDKAWLAQFDTHEEKIAASAFLHYRKQIGLELFQKKAKPQAWMEGFMTGMATRAALDNSTKTPPDGAA